MTVDFPAPFMPARTFIVPKFIVSDLKHLKFVSESEEIISVPPELLCERTQIASALNSRFPCPRTTPGRNRNRWRTLWRPLKGFVLCADGEPPNRRLAEHLPTT